MKAYACTHKRGYPTEKAARLAHRTAGFRIRVYWCRLCRAFHATNSEKGGSK